MKIMNRKAFLTLPAGTVYAKYSSLGCWGDLAVKMDSTRHDDWYHYDLLNGWGGCDNSDQFMDKVRQCEKGQAELRNDLECEGRDGLFEEDELFVVYDRTDILQLVNKLQELLA
jgi:hypothetical protein